jgi:glycosyltransferase involved in cell wall biosynthesis
MRLCVVGDAGSIHVRRWVEHFAKNNELLVVSDFSDQINGVRVEQVFVKIRQIGKLRAEITNLRRIRQMQKLVREFQPDIVHGHYLPGGGLYASLSGGKRIVGHAWSPPKKSLKHRLVLWLVLRRCDLLFAVSEDTADRIRDRGYKGDLELVRFGVDPEKFKRFSRHGTDEFRILSFRYCRPIYNPLVIVSGFKKALPWIKNACLYLFDSGDQSQEVHALVDSDPELASHVRFFHEKQYDEMPELYNSADVGISIPSSDGMPSSVIEAMSCELPVIVAEIPSMKELVEPSVTGYVTKISPDCVGDILIKAYAARSLFPEMGKRARARVLDPENQLTWESNMQVAEAAYRRLVQAHS